MNAVEPLETYDPAQWVQLRKQANMVGFALLAYFGFLLFAATGIGYLTATLVAIVGLLAWKKTRYFSNVILQKGKPMCGGDFLALLSLAMAPQLVGQLCDVGLQCLLESWGMDGFELQKMNLSRADAMTMVLYVGIAAPIAEELLFRGLLLRALAQYNKKLAIFASSLLFGLFHSSLTQLPYAFLLGLVLGYVALEYHIIWAVIMHLFNNLVFAVLLPQILAFLPTRVADWIMWACMTGFFLAAVLVIIARNEQVRDKWREERVQLWQKKDFFRAPIVIALMGLCLLNLIATTYIMLS